MATKLDELETLLTRIWSGELSHDQQTFYSVCGTTACVCGWDYAIDKYNGDIKEARDSSSSSDAELDSLWNYSQNKYDLTDSEAWLLFSKNSTLKLQQATLTQLKKGKSINIRCLSIASSAYDADEVELDAYPQTAISDFFHSSGLDYTT
jgi:hypothetical protein